MGTKLDYNQELYYKTIICDFDDTISTTNNKDWVNSKPDNSVVEKINFLYDNGWQIIILTARGQLSCKGDYELADKKYRNQIEKWLNKYGVKYHKLSFQKYLGFYYVDDKNISIKDFCDLNINTIKSGKSGALVYSIDGRVYKTHENITKEISWYYKACSFINTPKIYSFIGDTLCLEYIYSENNIDLNTIHSIIDVLKKIPNNNKNSFTTYIDRVEKHCDVIGDFFEILNVLREMCLLFDEHISFCHGDLSVQNTLFSNSKCFLIDPIHDDTFYSSYLLDVSKYLFSLRKNMEFEKYNLFEKTYHDLLILIKPLEITQSIRTIKYLTGSEKVDAINLTKELIDEYFTKYK
jgi:capsule biosynthesis phosphatase